MPDYFVTYAEHRYTISDTTTGVPYEGYYEEGLDVTLISLSRDESRTGRYYERVPPRYTFNIPSVLDNDDVPAGDTALVVWAKWTDGDTFGYSGYWGAVGVYATPEKACRASEWAKVNVGTGYFGRLDDVVTEKMEVLG